VDLSEAADPEGSAARRALDQAQLVVVRGATLPGIHLGNATLIDTEISRDIVLHLTKGEPALDFTDSLIIKLSAHALRWSCSHITPHMYDQS
jgi:hypothetical protein